MRNVKLSILYYEKQLAYRTRACTRSVSCARARANHNQKEMSSFYPYAGLRPAPPHPTLQLPRLNYVYM